MISKWPVSSTHTLQPQGTTLLTQVTRAVVALVLAHSTDVRLLTWQTWKRKRCKWMLMFDLIMIDPLIYSKVIFRLTSDWLYPRESIRATTRRTRSKRERGKWNFPSKSIRETTTSQSWIIALSCSVWGRQFVSNPRPWGQGKCPLKQWQLGI